jgi:CheY-like chemotaxis protein
VAEAKNLSETGLLAKVDCKLTVGQRAAIRLTLDDHKELILNAEVCWSRPELQLVGMEFLSLEHSAAEAILACIQRLRDHEGPDRAKLILVADDDSVTAELFLSTLMQAGYEVRRAHRGDEVLQLVRRLKPRLLILDVLLPALDGKDVCKRIRADAEMVATQVLLASGLDRVKLHAVAQEAGATDYVSKPVSPEDLLTLVRRYAGNP